MAKILITGGMGTIGKSLCKQLKELGYSVAILSRTKHAQSEFPAYLWDVENNVIEQGALENTDYCIHLAGDNIGAGRWTSRRKKSIVDSRVKSTQLLFNKMQENKIALKAFISASAIGYYGTSNSDIVFKESDPPSSDFLGETCQQWEAAADCFEQSGCRVVKIRTGIVLSKQGGVLEKMVLPVRLGLGAAFGSGKQYMPWIHIDDLCDIYLKAIQDPQMQGPYNAVAPQHTTNVAFMQAIARVLKKPYWLPPVPAMFLKWIFGEMSILLLSGNKVSAEKMMNQGFHFNYQNLDKALLNLLIE